MFWRERARQGRNNILQLNTQCFAEQNSTHLKWVTYNPDLVLLSLSFYFSLSFWDFFSGLYKRRVRERKGRICRVYFLFGDIIYKLYRILLACCKRKIVKSNFLSLIFEIFILYLLVSLQVVFSFFRSNFKYFF